MSGHSFSNPCPVCGNEMNCYSDYKPFEHSSGECLNCGFYYQPKTGQMSLAEVNDLRKEHNGDIDCHKGDLGYLPPLKKADLNKYRKEIKNLW